MAYYAHAAITHLRLRGELLNFVIPTGNLGNALACILAHAIGVPIGRIVLATNANLTLHDFFAGGAYAPRPSIATLANAMDVGSPSNFERLRWLYPDDAVLRRQLTMDAIGDDAIRATIQTRWFRHGEVHCPHTATAVRTLEGLRQEGASGSWAAVATAHAAKFDTVIEPLIDRQIDVPAALAELLARSSRAEYLAAEYAALRGYLSVN
jgi:threonine synthase